MKKTTEQFDVAVIGSGPAGMIAAGRAAELGAKVVLLEKNQTLGTKLLATGNSRCNLTHAQFDCHNFIKEIGKNGKFLYSSLSAFGPREIIEFFENHGLSTRTESSGKVFPLSDKSSDVLKTLTAYLKKQHVKIITGIEVTGFAMNNDKIIDHLRLKEAPYGFKEKKLYAKHYIIATGGKSYPLTGSTGDGFRWAKTFQHTIVPPAPGLTPIAIKEPWIRQLQGLSLKNVSVTLLQKNKKLTTAFGSLLLTHFGISGPMILNMSKRIGELLADGEVIIDIDLKPALDEQQLDKRLQRDFETFSNKDYKNYLPELLPKKLVDVFGGLSQIDPHKKLHQITREERLHIVQMLKHFHLTADRLLGFNYAMITRGGINLKEIDSKTMRSKLITNLSFAGEVLDLDGPTGGYNLQICWSTGYAAGTYAIN
jgi:predicted Rossmann fold flavoprotein